MKTLSSPSGSASITTASRVRAATRVSERHCIPHILSNEAHGMPDSLLRLISSYVCETDQF
ncbi:MAG: hypothetical protein MUF86_17245 [Akkermansiaceae bacterium]|nr:hypothetical protein [Akkermansiaceae bacterium]